MRRVTAQRAASRSRCLFARQAMIGRLAQLRQRLRRPCIHSRAGRPYIPRPAEAARRALPACRLPPESPTAPPESPLPPPLPVSMSLRSPPPPPPPPRQHHISRRAAAKPEYNGRNLLQKRGTPAVHQLSGHSGLLGKLSGRRATSVRDINHRRDQTIGRYSPAPPAWFTPTSGMEVPGPVSAAGL